MLAFSFTGFPSFHSELSQVQAMGPGYNFFRCSLYTASRHMQSFQNICTWCTVRQLIQAAAKTAAPTGTERNQGLAIPIIRLQKRVNQHRSVAPPYCVSKLIQILHRCYRFYIYRKYRKINTFQKGRCTYACVAIVFLVGIAALSTFQSAKNNDSPFSDRLSLFLHSLK